MLKKVLNTVIQFSSVLCNLANKDCCGSNVALKDCL